MKLSPSRCRPPWRLSRPLSRLRPSKSNNWGKQRLWREHRGWKMSPKGLFLTFYLRLTVTRTITSRWRKTSLNSSSSLHLRPFTEVHTKLEHEFTHLHKWRPRRLGKKFYSFPIHVKFWCKWRPLERCLVFLRLFRRLALSWIMQDSTLLWQRLVVLSAILLEVDALILSRNCFHLQPSTSSRLLEVLWRPTIWSWQWLLQRYSYGSTLVQLWCSNAQSTDANE